MASIKEHYDTHLAPLYTWISDGADGPRIKFAEFLRALALRPARPDAIAWDLGAGSGFQTLPLAAIGYSVFAVDLSETLLSELGRDAATASLTGRIHPVVDDLRTFVRHRPAAAPEVILCMGDTLTHLPTLDDEARLIAEAAAALAPAGHLILSFRDHTVERKGTTRFIPVRSDADRIFTCFLEYGPTHVTVHDILHTRDAASGGWIMTVSAYEKLRLSPLVVCEQLHAAGFNLIREEVTGGLATIIASKPRV